MKFNNFEKVKEKIGKSIRKSALILGTGAITAGAIGHSTEAFAQTSKNITTEKIINGSKIITHQFTEMNPDSPDWNVNVNIDFMTDKKENEKPFHLYLFRGEGSGNYNYTKKEGEISPLESRINNFPSNVNVDCYEFKYTRGVSNRMFKIMHGNNEIGHCKGIPPIIYLSCSSDRLLRAVQATFGDKLAVDKWKNKDGLAMFYFDYVTEKEFYDQLHKLMDVLNQYKGFEKDYLDK